MKKSALKLSVLLKNEIEVLKAEKIVKLIRYKTAALYEDTLNESDKTYEKKYNDEMSVYQPEYYVDGVQDNATVEEDKPLRIRKTNYGRSGRYDYLEDF